MEILAIASKKKGKQAAGEAALKAPSSDALLTATMGATSFLRSIWNTEFSTLKDLGGVNSYWTALGDNLDRAFTAAYLLVRDRSGDVVERVQATLARYWPAVPSRLFSVARLQRPGLARNRWYLERRRPVVVDPIPSRTMERPSLPRSASSNLQYSLQRMSLRPTPRRELSYDTVASRG
jgi:hypothetical protein